MATTPMAIDNQPTQISHPVEQVPEEPSPVSGLTPSQAMESTVEQVTSAINHKIQDPLPSQSEIWEIGPGRREEIGTHPQ